MHCISLAYSNSNYYNTPARIIILIQEVCNLLIDLARKHCDPPSIFQVTEKSLSQINFKKAVKLFLNFLDCLKSMVPLNVNFLD